MIARILGHDVSSVSQMEEIEIVPKGYRLLILKSKVPMSIAMKVVDEFRDISGIQCAGIEVLKEVESADNENWAGSVAFVTYRTWFFNN